MANLANFTKLPNFIRQTSYHSITIVSIATFSPNFIRQIDILHIFAKLFSRQTFVLYGKSCRFATECVSFVHVWMQLANQLELCLHKQTQIVASVACRVGSQEFHSWIASLPLVSLLFIVIPTPFLNF